MKMFFFERAMYAVGREWCFTIFGDGAICDMDIERGSGPNYRAIAARAGYGENWRRYSRHHDLLHNLLAEAKGTFSAALHDAANGVIDFSKHAEEEADVWALQCIWSDISQIAEQRERLIGMFGLQRWRFEIDRFCVILDDVK